MSDGWSRPPAAKDRVGWSPKTVSTQTFTVFHRGAEIDCDMALDVLEAATRWTAAREPGVAGPIEVWAAPWNRLISTCVDTVAAFGGPLGHLHLPAADDLVTRMKARGLAVRHRQARRSAVDDAEIRAISQGWPVHYL